MSLESAVKFGLHMLHIQQRVHLFHQTDVTAIVLLNLGLIEKPQNV